MAEESKADITVIDKRAGGAEEQALARVGDDNTPGALLRIALERNLDLDRIEKLMALQERWEANEARKAYVAAMSHFKEAPPIIIKDRKVSYRNSKNQLTEYTHSSLAQVVAQCIERMARCGLHHEWKARQEKGAGITVTCTITHRQGHSEDTALSAPPDTSGSKNSIQAISSTVTYLERYTLLMALGLAPAEDDDGRRSERREPEGKEAPPIDDDPEPSKRALDAIKAFGRYLGQSNARRDLEQHLGMPAGRWGNEEINHLLAIWAEVRERAAAQQLDDDGRRREIHKLLALEPVHEPFEDEHPHGDPQ